MKQLFTVNLPEARSQQASAIYHYSDALLMCAEPAESDKFPTTQRLACPSAASRRGLIHLPGVERLSLPLMLEQWQHEPITLFSRSQNAVTLDLSASKLIVELTSSEPVLVQEAIELALAGLALDWEVQLYLNDAAAPTLHSIDARSHAKPYASLPIFGLLAAHVSSAAALRLGSTTLLPIKAISPAVYAEAISLRHRISL